jgi:hypothetical protein
MDKYRNPMAASGDLQNADTPLIAESLQGDFRGLLEIFDRHLESLSPDDNEARNRITQAKAAAERGLKLSRELLEVMKASS